MNLDEKSKIDDLNKSLYSRSAPEIRSKRRLHLHDKPTDIQTDWSHPEEEKKEVMLNEEYKDSTMSFLTKILVTSIIFFLVALGIGTFLVFKGENIVSAKNVDISINGPVSVAGGEPVSFEIQVTNSNNIKLETVDLAVDFPAGTSEAEDSQKELKSFRQLIDDIAPGGVGQKTIKAILYGEENTKKEIKVLVEYRVKGSNAVFQKEKTFDILISSSPLAISVSSYKEVNSNQEFEITAVVNSNSKEVIKNLLLKAVYPFGFTYISSDVAPIADSNTWRIGDIPPGGKKTIKIKGKLEGQDDEMRVFRFATGAYKTTNDKVIGTEYVSNTQEVSIKKPFMTVNVSVGSDDSNNDYVAPFNKPLRVDVSYFNNLQTPIIDGEVVVKLAGSAYDKLSVSSDEGLYRSINNEIVWNSITTKDLSNIEAGGSGRVSFTITPRDMSTTQKSVTNPDLKFDVSVNGKRNSESNVPEKIVSTAKRNIKISSNVAFGGQTLRTSGPFVNTGSIPPKADQLTTYTIVWTIDNTVNSVNSIEVRSSLPPYVKWMDKISPNDEDVSYDSSRGEVIWNAGSIGTNTAGTSKRKQVSFQLGLDASITQVGSAPILLEQSSLTAIDDFTGETLKSNLGTLNTRFSTDPSFKDGDDRVIQ